MSDKTRFWCWVVMIVAGIAGLTYCAMYVPNDDLDTVGSIAIVGVAEVVRRRLKG
jgi:hypothetical protein